MVSQCLCIFHVIWHACQLQLHPHLSPCLFSSTYPGLCFPSCAHRALAPAGPSSLHTPAPPFLDSFLKHLSFLLSKKWISRRYVHVPTPVANVQLNNGNMLREMDHQLLLSLCTCHSMYLYHLEAQPPAHLDYMVQAIATSYRSAQHATYCTENCRHLKSNANIHASKCRKGII